MSLNEQYIPLNLFLEKINKIKSQYSKNTKVKAQSMLGVVAAMAKESCLDIPKQHDIGCTIPEEYQKEHVLRYPDVSLSEIREAINAMAKNQRIEAIRCKIEEQEGMTVEDALKYAKEHIGNPACIKDPCDHRPWACSYCQFPRLKEEKECKSEAE